MDYFLYPFVLMEEYLFCSPVVFLLIVYFVVVKVLKLLSTPEPPRLYYHNDCRPECSETSTDSVTTEKSRIEELIDRCPMLKEP